ncbi:MAG: hypothetical protein OQK72_09650 [Gammaproteobacteria bacterium]|nr:hypothetical protein [Gammaproteobacteria bacterium]MCW9054996.1 hypothetical protein [Gammaproteobacteria bacterium]
MVFNRMDSLVDAAGFLTVIVVGYMIISVSWSGCAFYVACRGLQSNINKT